MAERRSFASRLLSWRGDDRDGSVEGEQDRSAVTERLRLARDPAYWRALAASFDDSMRRPGIDEQLTFARAASPTGREPLVERTGTDGFFVTPPLVDEPALRRALAALEVVERAGWPLVFAFVYDELWRCLRAPALLGLVHELLGDDARQLPGVWVHRVSPLAGARGWGPHVDVPGPARRMPDGAPSRLTAWLALSDATLDNGCLHVVPAPFARELTALASQGGFHEAEEADMNDVIRLLHGVRALPVAAGSLVAWRLDVLHWGGVSTGEASAARVALSFELAHADAPPSLDEEPSFALSAPVTFRQRLAVIGRGLLAYGKAADREPFAYRFVELGRDLVDEHR